jgi:hypothetical protein
LELLEAVHLILRVPQRAIPKTCDSTMQSWGCRIHSSRQDSFVVRVAWGERPSRKRVDGASGAKPEEEVVPGGRRACHDHYLTHVSAIHHNHRQDRDIRHV